DDSIAQRRMRVSYNELHGVLTRALIAAGLDADRAALCARLVADASCDGVPSHGLNLFPRLMTMIGSGVVDVRATPVCRSAHGALERWDGNCGVGNLTRMPAWRGRLRSRGTTGLAAWHLRTPIIGCVAART